MTYVSYRGRGDGLLHLVARTHSKSLRGAALGAGMLAALACLAPPSAADSALCAAGTTAATVAPPAWSLPLERDPAATWDYAQFRGLGCERCDTRTQFCVVNFIRWEYVCAPRGENFACAGSSGTTWCRYGHTCWDGICR